MVDVMFPHNPHQSPQPQSFAASAASDKYHYKFLENRERDRQRRMRSNFCTQTHLDRIEAAQAPLLPLVQNEQPVSKLSSSGLVNVLLSQDKHPSATVYRGRVVKQVVLYSQGDR